MSQGVQDNAFGSRVGCTNSTASPPPHFVPHKLILHPWRSHHTHAFAPSSARLTFYPDLTKPASLAIPTLFGDCRVFVGKKSLLPLLPPSPLILTPALKLLQISKARAAGDLQPGDTEPAAASLNRAHSFRHGHRRF